MAKSNLEKAIEKAAGDFALQIVEAVKASTLEELIALQGGASARKKPGPKPGKKKAAAKRGPGRPPKKKTAAAKPVKKKRVVKNYPKCAYPGCNKNRFVRGKGFCGEHWRMWKDGKIKDAEYYKKGGKATARKAPKKARAKKK